MTKRILLAATGLLAWALPVMGADGALSPAQFELQRQIRKLQQQVYTLNLLQELRLSAEQAAQLVPLCERVARITDTYVRRMKQRLPQIYQAYRDFHAEDELNRGFSPQVERRGGWAHAYEKLARESYALAVRAVEAEALQMLSEKQRLTVEHYKPRLIPRDAEQWWFDSSRVGALAKQLRQLNERQFQARKKELLREFVRRHEGRPSSRVVRMRKRYERLLERLRHTPANRLPQLLKSLKEEQLPQSEMEAVVRELAEIRAKIHPSVGPAGRYLLSPYARVYLLKIAAGSGSRYAMKESGYKPPSEFGYEDYVLMRRIRSLAAEVNLLNLINGLNLTRRQVAMIQAQAQAANRLRRKVGLSEHDKPFDSDRARQYLRVLSKIKADIEATGDVSNQTLAELKRLRKNYTSRKPSESDWHRYHQGMLALDEQLNKTLLASQLEVIKDYKPCFIPPKNLKDPVRVGQASDSSRYERALKLMRRLPAERVDDAIEQLIRREEKHGGPWPPRMREQRKKKIAEVVAKARRMSEADFAMSLQQLAAEIEQPSRKDQLLARLQQLQQQRSRMARQFGPRRYDRPSKAARFLLDERIVALLRKRAAMMDAYARSTPVDLSKGPRAENCEDGSCAISDDE